MCTLLALSWGNSSFWFFHPFGCCSSGSRLFSWYDSGFITNWCCILRFYLKDTKAVVSCSSAVGFICYSASNMRFLSIWACLARFGVSLSCNPFLADAFGPITLMGISVLGVFLVKAWFYKTILTFCLKSLMSEIHYNVWWFWLKGLTSFT